jgi:predicted nucleotidyltransferase
MLSERFDASGRSNMMEPELHPNHQAILDKFVKACQLDDRIAAALMVGSYVKGKADEHSDLDLYVFTTEEAYEDFAATRESFVRKLGEPLFMEDFGLPGIIFLIFPDGSEVEISYVRESEINYVANEPFKVLLDKKDITAGTTPRERQVDLGGQREKLRRLIDWFWHELSHFITAIGRGQLWWAQGQLEALRSKCVNLARLRNDFSDPDVGDEPYFKIENSMPVEQLAALQGTFPPMEKNAMLKAGFEIVQFFRELAPPLAQMHGITYPDALERVMMERLEILIDGRLP